MTVFRSHQELHDALDVLLALYLEAPENRGKVPSRTTVMELIEWSYGRCRESGGSIPPADLFHAGKPGHFSTSAAAEPPVLNKSGGSDVEGK